MTRSLRLVVTASACLAPAACTLIVDTAGLTQPPVTDAADASEEPRPATDARPGDDASRDAADAALCVDGPRRFCDDFDHAGSKWEVATSRGDVVVEGGGLSLPNGLRARVLGGPNDGTASLGRTLTENPGTIHCALDLKLDEVPASGEIDVVDVFASIPGAANHHFYLGLFDGAWSVAEYNERSTAGVKIDRRRALGVELPLRAWMKVVFDLSSTALTITANGTPTTLSDLSVLTGSVSRRLNVGVFYASANVQAASVSIDNIDCTTAP